MVLGKIDIYIFFSLLFLIGYIVRYYPRIKLKYAFGSDTFFHFYYADLFRKNKFKIPNTSQKVVINHVISYPYLYHFLLGLFNQRNRYNIEPVLSPLFDVLSVLIFVISTLFVFEIYTIEYLAILIIGFLYAFSPALLKFEGIPRAFQGSPRVFGQFLYLGHIMGYIIFANTGILVALLFSIIFGGLVWLSAKFAVQVMVFFASIFIIFFSDYYFSFFGSFLFAILVSKGKVFLLIKGHINHSNYLLKKLDISPKLSDFKVFRNHVSEMLKSLYKFNIRKFTNIFLHENYPLFSFLIYFPFFLIIFDYTLIDKYLYFYIWTCAGLIYYLLTSINMFKFLGENTRYLEFALLPAMYLSILFLLEHRLYWLILLYGFFSVLASLYYVNNFIIKFKDSDQLHLNRIAMFKHLNKLDPGNLFAMCSTGHPALLLSDFPVLSLLTAHLDLQLFGEDDFDLVGINFPYPSGWFDEIIKKFNIRYVSLTESEEKIYLNRYIDNKDLFLNNLCLIMEVGNLKLYEVVIKDGK